MAEHKMLEVDRGMLPANKGIMKKPDDEPPKEGAEERHLDPVIKNGRVVSTKPSIGKRVKSLFIAEDIGDVKSWLIYDVAIPFVKDTVLDLMETAFFGGTTRRTRGSKRRYSDTRTDYSASYKSQSSKRRERDDRDDDRRNRTADYRSIVLSDRYDAQNVVESLHDRIDRYGNASVADLLELVDQTSKYTDTRWGWTEPSQIGIKRVSNGYLIDVDRAEALDD